MKTLPKCKDCVHCLELNPRNGILPSKNRSSWLCTKNNPIIKISPNQTACGESKILKNLEVKI